MVFVREKETCVTFFEGLFLTYAFLSRVGKDKISASEISGSALTIGRIREHDIDCYERAIVKMIVYMMICARVA